MALRSSVGRRSRTCLSACERTNSAALGAVAVYRLEIEVVAVNPLRPGMWKYVLDPAYCTEGDVPFEAKVSVFPELGHFGRFLIMVICSPCWTTAPV